MIFHTWWRHQMETFSALLAICAGNLLVPGEFPTQRPVTRSFDVYFDLRPDKRLNKQSLGWWFETLSHSLWRHRNVVCSSWSPDTNVNMVFGEEIENKNEEGSRYDDVIEWKHFPCYCPFVQGIHRSPMHSPHKGQWCGALMFLWSAPE